MWLIIYIVWDIQEINNAVLYWEEYNGMWWKFLWHNHVE